MYKEPPGYELANLTPFLNLTERNTFKKLLGHTLFSDPLLSHFIIDKQLSFLKKGFAMIGEQDPLDENDSVLEVGCGPGYKIELLSSAFGFKGYGCDISENIITFAKNHCEGINFFSHDVYNPFNGRDRFKTIFTCMALQTIPDKTKALTNIYHALDRKGYLLIVEACDGNPLVNKYLANQSFHPLRRDQYKQLLQDNGFKVIHTETVLQIPLPFALINFRLWGSQHYPKDTHKENYKPTTLRTKLTRLLIRLGIAWDKCYLRFDTKGKRLFHQSLYPPVEIGMICRKI